MADTQLEVFIYTGKCPRLGRVALQDIAQSFANILNDFGVEANVEVTARTTTITSAEAGELNDE